MLVSSTNIKKYRARKTGIGQLSFSDIKQALLFPVLLLIGCSVLSSITSFIQERTMAALSEKITLRVRKEITKKFKTLPMSFFDNHQVGDIISRTTTGLIQLSQVLLTGYQSIFYFCRNNSCCRSDAVLYRKQAYFARLIADRWQFNCYN